jgi:hypothetical protein
MGQAVFEPAIERGELLVGAEERAVAEDTRLLNSLRTNSSISPHRNENSFLAAGLCNGADTTWRPEMNRKSQFVTPRKRGRSYDVFGRT